MKVGDSVAHAIEDWELGRFESAMLHACNAVDGTARKMFPELGSNLRFTKLLRESYAILGPMGMPGINLEATRFPVRVKHPKAPGGQPDLADVIYGIHRCSHGHGDELPEGFELIPEAAGPPGLTSVLIERGKIRLSDRIIFGLLAVAVLAGVNTNQAVSDGYFLSFGGTQLPINEWWGRADDFADLTAAVSMPSVTLNFAEWMGDL